MNTNTLRSTFSMRTGVAHLRSYPEACLLDLAFKQASPQMLSTPIMHEIIHHACANSAVNIAMQYRWLELMRQMMSTPALGVAVQQEHMEMAASLAAVEAFFQPLAEGIAQFAEFDCAVPDSRLGQGYILSPTDSLLWRLLAMKENIGSHIDELFAQLKSEQIDPRTIKRKVDVLCNHIQPKTGNDTYLIGYLTIKSLWNQYFENAGDTALRPSTFLHFIMYYIYEDWQLAGTITMPGPIQLETIIYRLSNRIKQLFTSDFADNVTVFTNDVLSREKERKVRTRGKEELQYGAFAGLGLTKWDLTAGMLSVSQFYQKRVGPGAELSHQKEIRNLTNLPYQFFMSEIDKSHPVIAKLMSVSPIPAGNSYRVLDIALQIPELKRSFCFLLDIDVELRSRGGNQLLISLPDNPEQIKILPTNAATRFSDTPVPGRLVGIISSMSNPWNFYNILFCDEHYICTWSHGEQIEIPEIEKLILAISTEFQLEADSQISLETASNFVMKNEQIQEFVNQRAEYATQKIVKNLHNLLKKTAWEGLIKKDVKHDFGIRNIVPSRQLKCLAAAGICNAFSRDQIELAELMQSAGYSLADVLKLSEKVEKESNVTLIRKECDQIYVQI